MSRLVFQPHPKDITRKNERLEDERDTILLSWNLGPKVNSRNRPKFLRETRLVATVSLSTYLSYSPAFIRARERNGKRP